MGSRREMRDENDDVGRQDGVCELKKKRWVSLPEKPLQFPI